MERCSPGGGEVVLHVLARPCMLPASSGLDVCSVDLPCLDPFRAEDVPVDLFELVPLVIGPVRVKRVCRAAVIEARNGFLDPKASGVAASELSLVSDSSGHCPNGTAWIQFLLAVGKGM